MVDSCITPINRLKCLLNDYFLLANTVALGNLHQKDLTQDLVL